MNWEWPQYTIAVWLTLIMIARPIQAAKSSEPHAEYRIAGAVMFAPLFAAILYFGGFWN